MFLYVNCSVRITYSNSWDVQPIYYNYMYVCYSDLSFGMINIYPLICAMLHFVTLTFSISKIRYTCFNNTVSYTLTHLKLWQACFHNSDKLTLSGLEAIHHSHGITIILTTDPLALTRPTYFIIMDWTGSLTDSDMFGLTSRIQSL